MITISKSFTKVFLLFIFSFFVFIPPLYSYQDKYDRGLYFRSNETEKDNRTSLILTPDQSLKFSNGLTMSFDIKLRWALHNYGYIFRIAANDSLNIDFLSMDVLPESDLFSLVLGNKSIVHFSLQDFKNKNIYNWLNIRFSINEAGNQLEIKIDDIEKVYQIKAIDFKNFNIFFGANDHHLVATTDVSTMTIRNLKIYNKNKIVRSWELGRHGNNAVYDSCSHSKACVKNPIWLMDDHIKWKMNAKYSFPFIDPQIAFDEDSGRIFLAKDKYMFVYHITSEKLDTIIVKKGSPYDTRANQLIYNKNKKELISYNFDSNTLNRFNFKTREWDIQHDEYIPPKRWHHSKTFVPEDNLILAIGGYGFYEYKKDIFTYSMQDASWKKFTGDSTLLTPRYLGSLGYMGKGEFLYFGGLGNASGHQEELPINYYDLFKIDTRNNSIKKLWTLNNTKNHFVNGNSLIINDEKSSFYTLTYPDRQFSTRIRLCKFDITKPNMQFIADSIAFQFNDNESYCDLFYFKAQKKLIAITAHSRKPNLSSVGIYSINYPPLNYEDVWQEAGDSLIQSKWYYIIFIALGIVLISFVFFRLKNRINFHKLYRIIPKNEEIKKAVDKNSFDSTVKKELARPSSLNLLGGLQITDVDGNNVTNHFTNILGQIFLLTLLSTIKNGEGISTSKLIEAIWSYKDDKKARNNLYVHINKLRPLLKTIGNIEFASKEGVWEIVMDKSVYCDYKESLALINATNKDDNMSKEVINELLDLAIKGDLLSNLQWECLDSFKSDYTNLLIDRFSFLMDQDDIIKDLQLLLKTANAILIFDNIDENALKMKCHALYHLGKKKQTIECFDKFRRDYLNLLGSEYKVSFTEFMDKII